LGSGDGRGPYRTPFEQIQFRAPSNVRTPFKERYVNEVVSFFDEDLGLSPGPVKEFADGVSNLGEIVYDELESIAESIGDDGTEQISQVIEQIRNIGPGEKIFNFLSVFAKLLNAILSSVTFLLSIVLNILTLVWGAVMFPVAFVFMIISIIYTHILHNPPIVAYTPLLKIIYGVIFGGPIVYFVVLPILGISALSVGLFIPVMTLILTLAMKAENFLGNLVYVILNFVFGKAGKSRLDKQYEFEERIVAMVKEKYGLSSIDKSKIFINGITVGQYFNDTKTTYKEDKDCEILTISCRPKKHKMRSKEDIEREQKYICRRINRKSE